MSKSQQKRRFVNRHLPFSGNYFAEGKNPACRRARPLRAAPPGGRNLEAALDRGHVGHLLLAVVSQAVSPVDDPPIPPKLFAPPYYSIIACETPLKLLSPSSGIT